MRTLNRFVQMRSAWLAIIVCLGLAIPAYAATIFSEDYEVANKAALAGRGWYTGTNNTDDDGTQTIQIVPAPAGRTGRVLRLQYQGVHVNDNYNDKIVINFAPAPEIYVRYYKRTDPIPSATQSGYSGVTGKQHYLKVDGSGPDSYPNFVTNHWFGERKLEFATQGAVDSGGVGTANNQYSNMSSVHQVDGRWYCIEYHVKMNTPNVANGVQEVWVDGVQTLGLYNRNLRDTAHANAAFTNIEVYRQGSDNMYRYEDDLVLATTRVGCSGSPSADITPPMRPSGLFIR